MLSNGKFFTSWYLSENKMHIFSSAKGISSETINTIARLPSYIKQVAEYFPEGFYKPAFAIERY
jgi:hypothetical protein